MLWKREPMRAIDADHLRRWILSRVFKIQLNVADDIDQIDWENTIEPEIVRCKDCMHYGTYYHGTGSDPVITHACVWFLDRAMGLEDYCSKGVFR